MKMSDNDINALEFYLTQPHACSYLENQQAVSLIVDPAATIDTSRYSALSGYGFRRSGAHVYRPQCPDCKACIPVRIPVADFKPKRTQKRILRRNEDMSVHRIKPEFSDEHFALYLRYQTCRHPGGGMDDPNPDKYMGFIKSPAIETLLYEFRQGADLMAVAVVDQLTQALSSVYTFYDPRAKNRSLGVYTLLWTIEEAQRLRLNWLYLGYWIAECPKMSYKDQYRPLEAFVEGHWSRLP